MDNISSLGKELEQKTEKRHAVNQEVSRAFNRGSRTGSSQPGTSSSTTTSPSSSSSSSIGVQSTSSEVIQISSNRNSAPKFRLAYNFMRGSKRQQKTPKKSTKQPSGTFVKDVILLGGPEEDKVPRQGARVWLFENNHIVSGANIRKEWDFLILCDYLKTLYPTKLGEFDDIQLLMTVHSKLLPPNLAPGQQLSGFMLQKIFKDRPIYIRPSKHILDLLPPTKKRKCEYEVNDKPCCCLHIQL